MKKETSEQTESRLKAKKAALRFRAGKGLAPKEESTLLRARRANLKETRSGARVVPMKKFSSDKKDKYANPNE